VEPVVTLDVLIDEKGNVAETKVLSGSRALQRAAEQAVGLWQFVPARSGGQPVPTHVTLTVEFQR
jgi:TonB family protein